MEIDLQSLTEEELVLLATQVRAEVARRSALQNAEKIMEQTNLNYLSATGREPGEEWVQPQGAHDAYPVDWIVVHNGIEWVNLTPFNVWEPGVSGWEEYVPEGEYPEWIRPTGAHDAYNIGDRVIFEEQVWESLIDGNTWSPTEYPAGWKIVEEEEEPEA